RRARPALRARAAVKGRLRDLAPDTDFVQFIDGDCELRDGWIATARATLAADPGLAVVCGRRRERFPDASIWNRMIDAEWDTPVGEAKACGGDALMRMSALAAVGGYRDDLIAGEEPEMCFRMRALGWRIRRIDAEMTWHDAALTRVSQWWRRSQRAGHAFGEGAALHGASPERYRLREVRRALVWGGGLPLLLLVGLLVTPWALALLLVWPLQMLRLALRGHPWPEAVFLTLGKFPEAHGILSYWAARLLGRKRDLIEYK
ncbi:MAG: glycosyltransferase family 2 protein, partial [Pseudomonadota bacterium]